MLRLGLSGDGKPISRIIWARRVPTRRKKLPNCLEGCPQQRPNVNFRESTSVCRGHRAHQQRKPQMPLLKPNGKVGSFLRGIIEQELRFYRCLWEAVDIPCQGAPDNCCQYAEWCHNCDIRNSRSGNCASLLLQRQPKMDCPVK